MKNSIAGNTYIRRLASEYEEIAKNCGFKLLYKFSIDFVVHRYFERFIAKNIYNLFYGDNQTEKRLNANKNILFRFLSFISLFLSFKPIKKKNKNYFGNTFFVFQRIN